MAGWKDEYLAHLRNAEKNNPVNMEIVEACIDSPQQLPSVPSSPQSRVDFNRPID